MELNCAAVLPLLLHPLKTGAVLADGHSSGCSWQQVSCDLQTLEKIKGIEVLKEACAACGEAILVRKGRMIVKDEARVVSTQPFYLPSHGVFWLQ